MQRTMWFRITASVVALALCAGVFGSLLYTSHSIESQRQSLYTALSNQNLKKGDEYAVSLKNNGEVFVSNHRYGGAAFTNTRYPLFDDDGNIINIPLLVEDLLGNQQPKWAPDWLLERPQTTWMLAITFTAWLLLIVWMQITLPFVLTLVGTAIPVWLCWMLNAPQWMLAFGGMGMLIFTFVLLTRTALIALNPSYQVLAVAHTVLKEASRTWVSLLFIVVLLIVLPLLPMAIGASSPLRYRMQTYISWSMGITFSVAAIMTLFFSCASVAFEIRDRQIWQLMTKPLARLNYLLGKWLGVVVINFILLIVAGLSTFTFIQYLRNQPVASGEAGQLDALAVNDEVLTARVGAPPNYEKLTDEQIRQRVEQRQANDTEFASMDKLPAFKRLEWIREMQQTYSLAQRALPPGKDHIYVFSGLKEAKTLNSTLTLRYRFHILGDDEHKTFKAGFEFLDDQNRPIARQPSTYVPTMTHSFPIGSHLIQDDGTLRVKLYNLYDPGQRTEGLVGALNFDEEDFELLYKVAGFEGNFFRALLMMWIKLAFLAALGISCATFLSFPVACLLSFTVFLGGMLGPYLAEALQWYYPPETQTMDWSNVGLVLQFIFETCTRAIANFIVFLLSSFGEYRPTQNLVEGRLIEWSAVAYGFLKLGLLWSGLSMLIGYLVMRNRQLAIYSGQG